jgi:DNA polymerase III delta prime subunit
MQRGAAALQSRRHATPTGLQALTKQKERDMKGTTVTLLAAAAGIIFAQLPATAQNRASSEGETSQRQQVLAPNIARVAVRATQLHWGMLQADIARVMPAPSQVVAAVTRELFASSDIRQS